MSDDMEASGETPDEPAPLGRGRPEPILDQAEVDRLLGVPGDGQALGADFRAVIEAGALPREPMPMLGIVFERLARALPGALRELLGSDVEAEIRGLGPARTESCLDELVLPSQIFLVRLEPYGDGLLAVHPRLADLILERLLGGDTGRRSRGVVRPFTALEVGIVQRVVATVIPAMSAAFGLVAPVAVSLARVEQDPRLVDLARPGEGSMRARLRLGFGGGAGEITVVLPLSTLEPLRDRLAEDFAGEKLGHDELWAGHLATEVWRAHVEANAVLCETRVPLRAILALGIGDTLPLPVRPSDLVAVRCGDRTLTRGRIGRVDGHIAIQVVEGLRPPNLLSPPGEIGR